MDPQQLAALLGSEVDAGFAAALSRLGASGALVVDTIRTRVGSVPDAGDEAPDWSRVPWLADVLLTPVAPLPTQPPAPDDNDPTTELTILPGSVRGRLAALPVAAIRGVGEAWAARLGSWGITHVVDLAEADPTALMRRAGNRIPTLMVLIARARTATAPWPAALPAGKGRSIADLATATPAASDLGGFLLREHCMHLLAVLDLDVAAATPVP